MEKVATVNEIVIKLNNFRSRRYPLSITVDGKEAFNATTETTLGYYTIKCKPQTGTRIKIQLKDASPAKVNDEVGVEVSGKKLDDGVTRNDAMQKER